MKTPLAHFGMAVAMAMAAPAMAGPLKSFGFDPTRASAYPPIVHAANNTALKALASTAAPVVLRDGFAVAGDAHILLYVSSHSPCSIGDGAGDGGSEVVSADGGCWRAAFSGDGADAREWGVVVSTFMPSNRALNAALAWANTHARTVRLPGGPILIDGSATITLNEVSLRCTAGPPSADASGSSLGRQGTTFWLTSTKVPPFMIGAGVEIEDCNYYWPNQTGLSATPTAYPALFTESPGSQMANVDFVRLRMINAYNVLDQGSSAGSDAFGGLHFTDVSGYAINHWFRLANVPETWTITGLHADFNLFQGVAGARPNQYLAKWTAAHGVFLDVYGDGDGATTTSAAQVQGLVMSTSSIFGYRRGVWVERTGNFNEADIEAIFDAVPQPIEVDAGGCIAAVRVTGLYFSYAWEGAGADNYPAFSLGVPASSGCVASIDIDGQLEMAQGDVVDLGGANWKAVSVSLQGAGAYGKSSTPGTYYFAKIDSPSVKFLAMGNMVEPNHVDIGHRGFLLANTYSAILSGNTFNGVYNPIDPSSNTSPIAITGNVSVATSSPYAIAGAGGANIAAAGNAFDRPNPQVDGLIRLESSTIPSTGSPSHLICTGGLGSGTCGFYPGATGASGLITLSPIGASGSTGAFTFQLPAVGLHAALCLFQPQNNGSSIWTPSATIFANSIDRSHGGATWTNGSMALTAGGAYLISYICSVN